MTRLPRVAARGLVVALGLCWSLDAAVCQADSFAITIDTRPLASQTSPPAPFSLELQFNDGDGTVSNTLTLRNFDFGPGGSVSGPSTTSGGASGDLSSTVTLTDSSFFNEFIQGFTPSASGLLSFLLDLGPVHVEPVTPDSFSLAIFDSSGTGIPTSFFDVFVQIDLTAPLTINRYASDPTQFPPGCPTCPGISIPEPTIASHQAASPVPEPGTIVLTTTGVVGLLIARRRNRKKARR